SDEDAVYRRIADPPSGIVDYTLKGFLIVRIKSKPKIGNQVFYLFSLIKGRTPVNFIGNIDFPQCLLHCAGLRVCTVENSEVAIITPIQGPLLTDGLGNNFPFFIIAEGTVDFYLFSRLVL